MKRLWAPWRMDYIRSPKPTGCVFCNLLDEQEDQQNLILYRGKTCFVVLNRYPYTNGHLMVAPLVHVDAPEKLADNVLQEMMQLVNTCTAALRATMRPDGFNIGMNIGKAAGAGIEDHIHMHIVPRWAGDTNFMPVCADTRVIVESLRDCYARLKPAFDQLISPNAASE